MKPGKTSIIEIGYIKEEERYFATFQVLGVDKNEAERIMKYYKIEKHQKDRKLYIKDNNLHVTDFFEADSFETMYPYLIESARQCIIPERIEPKTFNREIDLCMIEQNIDLSVRMVPNLKRYRDILEGVME